MKFYHNRSICFKFEIIISNLIDDRADNFNVSINLFKLPVFFLKIKIRNKSWNLYTNYYAINFSSFTELKKFYELKLVAFDCNFYCFLLTNNKA